MSRRTTKVCVCFLIALTAFTGCTPTQPFYLNEDGDLSHLVSVATDLEFPDLNQTTLADVENTRSPLTIVNPDFEEIWELSLEEAVAIGLQNSKIIRSFGQVRQVGQITASVPQNLLLNPNAPGASIYDPAIQESTITSPQSGAPGIGQFFPNGLNQLSIETPMQARGGGVEDALSEFDADFRAFGSWNRTDRPQNVLVEGGVAPFPTVLEAHDGNFGAQVGRKTAAGTRFFARNINNYNRGNQGGTFRAVPSVWTTALEVEMQHPLLRGGGVQVNRIPVVLARMNTDITLADFEARVRDFTADIERAYWELFFQYHTLQAAKIGRDSALVTWKKTKALEIAGGAGGGAEKEAQAKEQYYFFRAAVEASLRDLFKAENRLRYIMGIAATDGRLIRPSDEPSVAKVQFDWEETLFEALCRSAELRAQRWRVKQRELELIFARNRLLPILNVGALYRWVGVGDELFGTNDAPPFPADGSVAWQELMGGNYQEFGLRADFGLPIGMRRELAGVRNAQLLLARDKARLEEMELELSHQLTDAVQDLESQYVLVQTNFNRRAAAERQVEAVQSAYDFGTVTLDLLLDAQRRRADAEVAYYRALTEYNLAMMQVHLRRGSLLEYNGVMLAEGPWPQKAYFDAENRARRRDASYYLDYGFSRPNVVSAGQHPQSVEQATELYHDAEIYREGGNVEEIETPRPTPATRDDLSRAGAKEAHGGALRQPVGTGAVSTRPAANPRGVSQPQAASRPRTLSQPQTTSRSLAASEHHSREELNGEQETAFGSERQEVKLQVASRPRPAAETAAPRLAAGSPKHGDTVASAPIARVNYESEATDEAAGTDWTPAK